jgi:hypothetical protein
MHISVLFDDAYRTECCKSSNSESHPLLIVSLSFFSQIYDIVPSSYVASIPFQIIAYSFDAMKSTEYTGLL